MAGVRLNNIDMREAVSKRTLTSEPESREITHESELGLGDWAVFRF